MKKLQSVGSKVTQIAFQLDDEDAQNEQMITDMMNEAHWESEGGMKKDIDLSMKTLTDEYQNKISKLTSISINNYLLKICQILRFINICKTCSVTSVICILQFSLGIHYLYLISS